MADNMDKKIDIDEEMTLDELAMVNGGCTAEMSLDYDALSRHGLCKGDSEAQIVAAWADMGVQLVPSKYRRNRYYMNGQEITQAEAIIHLDHSHHHNGGSSMAERIAKKHQELSNQNSGYRSLS